ncbi:alpha/beta hydrolase [Mariniblastus sp.]|nr:alpha/beta hydrolase [Mariniblastus sp.]|eukprot:COSAG01_NODE_627_length_14711_cov_39.902614_5_plen_304_part_00
MNLRLCAIAGAVFVLLLGNSFLIAQDRPSIEIWPKGLPAGSIKLPPAKVKDLKEKEKVHPRGHVLYCDTPTLSVYLADPKIATGCGVIICPGGSYNVLAWQHEGVQLAEWFNSIGVTAFILKYRVPRRNPNKIHWEPMQDVQRAIRVVRQDAAKFKIAQDRIGVLGFSAGGHLTVMAGVQYDTQCYEPVDEADSLSARPDFICPIYAAYLGDGYSDAKAELGSLVKVTDQTPPAFMAVTWDDKFRGAQSALLFAKLKEHGVPAEFHGYSKGGHGYGIRESELPVSKWHHQLESWLKVSGFLSP